MIIKPQTRTIFVKCSKHLNEHLIGNHNLKIIEKHDHCLVKFKLNIPTMHLKNDVDYIYFRPINEQGNICYSPFLNTSKDGRLCIQRNSNNENNNEIINKIYSSPFNFERHESVDECVGTYYGLGNTSQEQIRFLKFYQNWEENGFVDLKEVCPIEKILEVKPVCQPILRDIPLNVVETIKKQNIDRQTKQLDLLKDVISAFDETVKKVKLLETKINLLAEQIIQEGTQFLNELQEPEPNEPTVFDVEAELERQQLEQEERSKSYLQKLQRKRESAYNKNYSYDDEYNGWAGPGYDNYSDRQ